MPLPLAGARMLKCGQHVKLCVVIILVSMATVDTARQCPTTSSSSSSATESSTSSSGISSEKVNQTVESVAHDWTLYRGSCYQLFEERLPWYPAEIACRSLGGHLASLGSDQENRLVGRLSNCRDAWIGRFGVDYHRQYDSEAYEWTDGSGKGEAGYHRHNFSSSDDPHMGAIKAAGLAWRNAHYHEVNAYVCEMPAVESADVNGGDSCPEPFGQFRTHCYWLSDFPASFVEASLHCERELSGHLASVRNPEELRFIGTLDLESDTCEMGPVWLGLIKQNPCRPAEPESGPRPCYQWTDFSGQHQGYPGWVAGQPLLEDWTVNCAMLEGQGLLSSEKCHTRLRFVCKKARAGVAVDRQSTSTVPPTSPIIDELGGLE